MLSLLGVTFVASFTDSLNPIAITQQMILQSLLNDFLVGFLLLIYGMIKIFL